MKHCRAVISLVLISAILLQGCTFFPDKLAAQLSAFAIDPTPTLSPVEQLTRFTNDEIKFGIQESMDTFARAYNANDPTLLAQVVDQDNLPFRRLVQSDFDGYQQSIYAGMVHFEYIVRSVKPMTRGFMLAHMSIYGDQAVDWTFRYAGDHWVLSEPTPDQLGEPVIVETDRFTFETYGWSRDYNQEMMDLMTSAADHVELDLGKSPDGNVYVAILPDYSLVPDFDPGASAFYYEGETLEDDTILVYSPTAFSFGSYDEAEGWQSQLEEVLVHEYTHLMHIRVFGNAGNYMDWLCEGLAEYVSDSDRIYEITDALEQDILIPIIDESGSAYPQDLMHLFSLKSNVSLGYAEAESLVGYIKSHYGGFNVVWQLANAFDESKDFDAALQKVFHTTYAEFDADWRAWIEIRYGP